MLGLSPGSSLQEIKNAYKRLSQMFHPDRFPENTEEHKTARAKFLTVQQSYKLLLKYQQSHGSLPKPATFTAINDTATRTRTTLINSDHKHQKPPTSPSKQPLHSSLQKIWLPISFIGLSVYFTLHISKQSVHLTNDALELQTNTETTITSPSSTTNETPSKQTHSNKQPTMQFTYGDSMRTVVEVQGAPTNATGNVWYYGKSKVIFHQGKVINWHSNHSNPLKASLISN